jgi:hypothetical protein
MERHSYCAIVRVSLPPKPGVAQLAREAIDSMEIPVSVTVGAPNKRYSIRLTPGQHAKLRAYCRHHGVTLSAGLRRIMGGGHDGS